MSEKCSLCRLKLSVPQGKIAVQRFFLSCPPLSHNTIYRYRYSKYIRYIVNCQWRKEWDSGKINLANHQHYGDWRDATRSCLPSQNVPIDNVSMEEARWGAVRPGTFVPVLTCEGKLRIVKMFGRFLPKD